MTSKDQKNLTLNRLDVRAEIAHQGIRGLVILNGGACVAVLGFIQAIWKAPEAPHNLVFWLFISLFLYALGAFFWECCFYTKVFHVSWIRTKQRYKKNMENDFVDSPNHTSWFLFFGNTRICNRRIVYFALTQNIVRLLTFSKRYPPKNEEKGVVTEGIEI